METAGAKKIFEASVEKHKLYYTSFYGDGDSKAYPAVKNVYEPDKPVTKYECIGHYQKRIGTRMRKKKKKTKGLGGRGRLTDAIIDKLQNYFGIALRQNCGDLNKWLLRARHQCFMSLVIMKAALRNPIPGANFNWTKSIIQIFTRKRVLCHLMCVKLYYPFTWTCVSPKT